jgi:UDP-N-acetylglucosamine--N-acetylmuramyl-(pentapeptide) pyrophosphoryl-undecaprenol N-acetylglucosamine transferase
MTPTTGDHLDGAAGSERSFAVVTGGGTAGHVLPALAVAEALVASGHDPGAIHYLGAERGIETRLVPASGFAHTFLDVVGVQRRLTRRNLAFVPKLWRARRHAITLLRALRPRVVVSVGGYASLPGVLAARHLDVPVVVVSYDRIPGRASALAARFAAASAVAFPDSPLPRATMTGAPVRAAILAVDRVGDRAAARAALGVAPDRFLVAVTGGSQGSGVLNGAMRAYVRAHAVDSALAVRHVVGERYLAGLASAAADGAAGVQYQVIGYEADMAALYAAADLLVGRGGASTVHEVAVTGVPAVLVPWAASAEDHQTANVRWLADEGAAVMLAEIDVTVPGALEREIERWRADPVGRAAMGQRAHRLGGVHRGGALAQLVEDVALA